MRPEEKKGLIGSITMLLFPIVLSAQSASPESLTVSLEQLFEQADAGNEALRAQSHRLAADSARIRAARGGLLPQLGAEADLSLLDILPKTKEPFIGDGPVDILVSAGVSQKIWDGGRTKADIGVLSAARDVEQSNRIVLEQSIRLRLAQSYYHLCGLCQELAVIEENLAMIDERLRYIGLLIDAGRMSEIERGRFEVVRSQLEGKRVRTRHAYESVCGDIGVLLGREGHVLYIPEAPDTLVTASPDGPWQLPEALSSAPVVDRQDALLRRADAETAKARAARMPSVTAKVWYGWEFAAAGFSPFDNDRWFVGLHATAPIFDGGTTRHRTAAAQSAVEAARIERDRTLRESRSVARDLTAQLGVLRERVAIENQAVEQAQQNLRLGLIEYEAGRRSNTDIIDMQNSVLQAQLNVNALIVDFRITRARLFSLAGKL
jgi:outer membrane protein TolC